MFQSDKVFGVARAIVPTIVAYLVGRGYIPGGAAAEVSTAILALGAAGWSVYEKRAAGKITSVAAMDETRVSADGRTITVTVPELAKAARDAATPPIS